MAEEADAKSAAAGGAKAKARPAGGAKAKARPAGGAKAKPPKPPKPPKPWTREAAGRYRSGDERFAIEGEPGRWFVVDEGERDELGLARTLGPFDGLKGAEAEAERLRSTAPQRSSLVARLAKAEKTSRSARDGVGVRASAGPARGATARLASPEPGTASEASTEVLPPEPPAPREPVWLRRLSPDRAEAIRQLQSRLARLGLPSAWDLARAEVASNEPAVAHALLARRIRRRAVQPWRSGEGLDPERLPADVARALDRLRGAGAASEDLRALAAFVAERAVAVALEEVSEPERDPDTGRATAGWRLVEHAPDTPSAGRRIHLGGKDLAEHEASTSDRSGDAGAAPGAGERGGRRPGHESATPGTLRS